MGAPRDIDLGGILVAPFVRYLFDADDYVHRSVLREEANLLVIEFNGLLHPLDPGRELHDSRDIRFLDGAGVLGRVNEPSQKSVVLVDATEASEEDSIPTSQNLVLLWALENAGDPRLPFAMRDGKPFKRWHDIGMIYPPFPLHRGAHAYEHLLPKCS
jgi:hypothetical protein